MASKSEEGRLFEFISKFINKGLLSIFNADRLLLGISNVFKFVLLLISILGILLEYPYTVSRFCKVLKSTCEL